MGPKVSFQSSNVLKEAEGLLLEINFIESLKLENLQIKTRDDCVHHASDSSVSPSKVRCMRILAFKLVWAENVGKTKEDQHTEITNGRLVPRFFFARMRTIKTQTVLVLKAKGDTVENTAGQDLIGAKYVSLL